MAAQDTIASREWRWLAIASLVVVLATCVPYVAGWLASTPDMLYGGFVYGHEDMHSYLAKMRYGARDGWLFELVYTSEPHPGAFVFPFHLGLGKLAAWLSGRPTPVTAFVAAYHAARIAGGLAMLAASYAFIAAFLSDVGQRRLAWLLVAIGGGLGWLVLPLFGPEWLGSLPNEFYIPEGYSFLTLLILPHLALARALMLAGWLAWLRAVAQGSWRIALVAGLAWLAMGLLVPFYVALVDVLLAIWLAALWLRTRHLPVREGLMAALPVGLTGSVLAYNVWVFSQPIFETWAAQNRLPSPHPLHYVAAYGVLAVLALFGARPLWEGEASRAALAVGWTLAAPVLVYLPINVQRRLAEGAFLPLCVLAVAGLEHLTASWKEGQRRLARAALVVVLVPSSLVMLVGGIATASHPRPPIFHPREELAALAWLDEHAPQDAIVLASFAQGNVIPAYADVRVYAGHGPETIDSERKRQEVAAFFDDDMTGDERLVLLEASTARYVFAGPAESTACDGAGCFDPVSLGLVTAYDAGGYRIYEVSR